MKRMKTKNVTYKTILGISFLALLLNTGCGKQEAAAGGDQQIKSSSIIVGDVDWKEVTSLSSSNPVRKNSKAVANIDLPKMGSRCTGFLISNNVLMTNHHCIPSSSHANGVTVTFKHEKGVSQSAQKRFNCSTFIGNNRELDFALLKCSGNPGATYGFVELDSDEQNVGESIYVVQQNCDYYMDRGCDPTKKYSSGKITSFEKEYAHNADTLGGSSGSPVFSWGNHKVVAIHHAGYGNNGLGRGFENYAVPMSKIVPYIMTHFPSVDIGGSSGGSSVVTDKPKGNDTMAGATKARVGSRFSGSISSSKDLDFFKFSSIGKTVKVELTFTHSKGDLDLYLADSKGKVIAKSESTKSKESFSKYLKKGTYYVLVKGYKGAKGKYKLSIK